MILVLSSSIYSTDFCWTIDRIESAVTDESTKEDHDCHDHDCQNPDHHHHDHHHEHEHGNS